MDWVTGVQYVAGAGSFSLLHCIQTGCGAHLASYPVDTGNSFPGSKALGHETNHSPLTSAQVKNAWNHSSTPPYVFMA